MNIHPRVEAYDSHSLSGQTRAAALIVAVGFVVSAFMGLLSDGLHQFDDLTHFLFARWAWTYPLYLLDDWGRPGFTALYFIPAGLSQHAARFFSAVLSAATAWMAFRIGTAVGLHRPWRVALLTFAQPMFFELSLTTLTETALAFYLTAAILLFLRGRIVASAAILSVAFVTRHEAIIFAPIWIAFAIDNRAAFVRLWPMPWAIVLVSGLAVLFHLPSGVPRWFEPHPGGWYGRGGWYTYLSRCLEAWGPAIAVMGFAGLAAIRGRRPGLLVAVCAFAYFLTHTVVRMLGAYESGGYPRFLVPISPLIAIGAAACWEQLESSNGPARRRMARDVAIVFVALWLAMELQIHRLGDVAAFLPEIYLGKWTVRISTLIVALLAMLGNATARRAAMGRAASAGLRVFLGGLGLAAWFYLVHVLHPGPGESVAREAVQWLRANGYGERPMLTAHVYVEYLSERIPPPAQQSLRRRVADAPNGSIVAWDRQFAPGPDQDLARDVVEGNPAFRLLHAGPVMPYESEPQIRLYEKIGSWP